jgi:hypothetical protein
MVLVVTALMVVMVMAIVVTTASRLRCRYHGEREGSDCRKKK